MPTDSPILLLALGRSALWKGESKATQLPPSLTVQFVRFFWKTNVSAADGTQGERPQPYSDGIVANRNATVWHGATENGP